MRSILLIVALASACADDPEIREGVLAPLRTPCTGEGSFMCLRLHDTTGDETHVLYGGIDGYTQRWGVEARVRYHTVEIADPPADGSARSYVVDEIVAEIEDAAGPEFDLAFPDVPPGNGWFAPDGDGRLDMAGTAVLCALPVCNLILARTDLTAAFRVRFQLDGPSSLRAISVD
jgi:hypothetical protein